MMQQIKRRESESEGVCGGGDVSEVICQEREFCIAERETDTCGRGAKESFIISLSLSSTKSY